MVTDVTPDQMLDEQEPTGWSRAMAEHEASLVRGAHVRCMPGEGCASTSMGGIRGHVEAEAGATGRIVNTMLQANRTTLVGAGRIARTEWAGPMPNGHRFYVEFDESVKLWDGLASTHGAFCSSELVVLRAADPDEEGED